MPRALPWAARLSLGGSFGVESADIVKISAVFHRFLHRCARPVRGLSIAAEVDLLLRPASPPLGINTHTHPFFFSIRVLSRKDVVRPVRKIVSLLGSYRSFAWHTQKYYANIKIFSKKRGKTPALPQEITPKFAVYPGFLLRLAHHPLIFLCSHGCFAHFLGVRQLLRQFTPGC